MDGQTAMLCKGRILVVSAERGQRRRTQPLGWQRKEKPVKVTEAPPGGRGSRSQGEVAEGKLGDAVKKVRVENDHWGEGWSLAAWVG